jgi:hypothetical protein
LRLIGGFSVLQAQAAGRGACNAAMKHAAMKHAPMNMLQ